MQMALSGSVTNVQSVGTVKRVRGYQVFGYICCERKGAKPSEYVNVPSSLSIDRHTCRLCSGRRLSL